MSNDAVWRMFVGHDVQEPDDCSTISEPVTWEQARDQLAARLAEFADDECPFCRDAAAEAAEKLAAATPGMPFTDSVDGDDYAIVEASVVGSTSRAVP